ncbi:MAG: DUF4831 family protein [Prevotella sp.]|nr:DUF4831 family protein [Prevotella sp.]
MKKIATLLAAVSLMMPITTSAQSVQGTSYFLPKTVLKFHLLVEKTTFKPGELAEYADKYMKLRNVGTAPNTSYKIVRVNIEKTSVPDSSKMYTALIDKKHSIFSIKRTDEGILQAINAEGEPREFYKPFKSATKAKVLNAKDYMNQDILSAGSSAKMAELIAQDIYEIRESRNELSRGNADYMPKDGAQLKIMLSNLDTQEKALMQVFTGTTEKDTTEHVVTFIPEKTIDRTTLFRFSKKLGLVDADDLSGEPYYISISDEHIIPELPIEAQTDEKKKDKDNCGVYVNLPGKINITLTNSQSQLITSEIYAAQFGRTESLSGELFGRKLTTHLIVDPITGNAKSLKVEPIE